MLRKMFGLILLGLISVILIGCSANYRLGGIATNSSGGRGA